MTRSMITAALLAAGLGLSGCSQEESNGGPEPEVAVEPPASEPTTPQDASQSTSRTVSDAGQTGSTTPKKPEPSKKPAPLDVGQAAPDFTLANIGGDLFQMHGLRGKRVVLEWFNPECPYTRHTHLEGSLTGMSTSWTAKGVVWLTINSSAPGQQGHGIDMNAGFKSKYKIANDLLLDESGEVGKAYGAKRTPSVFVIDEKGTVVYMGSIDNKPMGSLLDGHTEEINYLEQALQDLEAGRPVATAKTRAFGCSVRYAKP